MNTIITICGWIFLAIVSVALIALVIGVFFTFWEIGEALASNCKWRKRIMRTNEIKNAYVCAKYLKRFDIPNKDDVNIFDIEEYFYKRLKETEK